MVCAESFRPTSSDAELGSVTTVVSFARTATPCAASTAAEPLAAEFCAEEAPAVAVAPERAETLTPALEYDFRALTVTSRLMTE